MIGRANKKINFDVTNTIIGQGIKLEAAVLTGKESVRIDGEYVGDVDIDGNLIIGETGNVVGNLRVKYVVIAGRLKGNIRCTTVVHIAPTAMIEGNIETQSLVVDDGGQLNGTCHMGVMKVDTGELPELGSTVLEKY